MRISSLVIAALVCVAIIAFIFRPSLSAEDQAFENLAAAEAAQAEAQSAFATAKASLASADETLQEAQLAVPQEAETIEAPVGISVLAMTSNETDVTSGILLRGQTAAFKSVGVKAQTSGSVISPPIRKGTVVTKGQLLCELEVGTKAAALAEAQARLLEAEANNTASANLVKKGFASETTAIARQAELESAIAALDRAQTDFNNTKIIAPFNGLLESDTAELGDFMQTGAACATVLALDPIKLVGYATEQQVARIEVGAAAGARLIDGQQVRGSVSFISRSADQTTRTFLVETTVPNENLAIRDGSTADIYIALAGVKGHLLPQSSLTLNGEGKLGVHIADGDQAKFMPVDIIRDAADGTWVTGLPETIDVIVVGQEYVTEGSKIKATYKGNIQ